MEGWNVPVCGREERCSDPSIGLAIHMIIIQKKRAQCGHESRLFGRTGEMARVWLWFYKRTHI